MLAKYNQRTLSEDTRYTTIPRNQATFEMEIEKNLHNRVGRPFFLMKHSIRSPMNCGLINVKRIRIQ